jgi:fructosamine-3-kinase
MSLPPGASEATPVGGGDINEAWRVRLGEGVAFVKTRADARPGEYRAEARGLRWLAEAGALPLPEVLDVGEDYLALQWIEPGHLGPAGEELLGRGLARLHAAGAPHFGDPWVGGGRIVGAAPAVVGADRANGELGEAAPESSIGSLRLPNAPSQSWPAFYVERRLRPLAAMARDAGAVSSAGLAALERLCERMDELAGPAEPPARLHGDLWWGNVLAGSDGRPWLIDPSAYGGHREVDLAMLRLFGGEREQVFAAYEEVAPLAAGWEERVALWQLLPLLVHALLFGGSYGAAVERIARRYAG